MRKHSNIYRYLSCLVALVAILFWLNVLSGRVGLVSAQTAGPSWSFTGNLNTARAGHTATVLPNGKVLVAGGATAAGAIASAELYDPTTGTWSVTGSLNVPRYLLTATLLSDGKVLAVGGFMFFN